MTHIADIARNRYTTKAYSDRKISAADEASLKDLLQLAASSVNSQPWHFIMASTDEGKARVAKATESYAVNTPSILKGSHAIVFASRVDFDDAYLSRILEQEDADGRYATAEIKAQRDDLRKFFVNLHKEAGDTADWAALQLYLNLGSFLLGVAAMGLDATPMEGLDPAILDEEFDLPAKGYKAHFVVVVGYRSEDDRNATLPKSRLPQAEIITEV